MHTAHCLTASLNSAHYIFQVKALKEKIENEKGKESFPVAGQKLIYAGVSLSLCLCSERNRVEMSDVGVFE